MSAAERPVWFLDVDGVINAVTRGNPPSGFDDHKAVPVRNGWGTYRIVYSPTLIAFINEVHTSGRADVRWLTTWGKMANDYLRDALGLPELTVVAECPVAPGDQYSQDEWWKFAAIKQHMAEGGGPFIWTDDDIEDEHAAPAVSNGSLVIAPHPTVGLTADHVQLINSWLG